MVRSFRDGWFLPAASGVLAAALSLPQAAPAQEPGQSPKPGTPAVSGLAQAVPSPPEGSAPGQPVAPGQQPGGNILDLNIDQLSQAPVKVPVAPAFDVDVTSVSKEPTKVGRSPAAVYVITQEDIRRSGFRSVPDALRMAPGVDVARYDANKWAISIRGFNDLYANKLLVMIDGRSIYTPTFGGVIWHDNDLSIEDVDRIEVIRGPGATLWGANAVNGVINIITKKAQETQGGLVTAGGGSEYQGFGSVRYGGKLGDDAYYRVYLNGIDRKNGVDISGQPAADAWNTMRGGVRLDWEPTPCDSVMFQGELFSGRQGDSNRIASLTFPFALTIDDRFSDGGGFVLSKWSHKISDTADTALQFYYDHTEYDWSIMKEIRDTIDLDFQHRFALTPRQEVVWGLGYRFTTDTIGNSFTISLEPPGRGLNLFSGFIQDDITLVPERWHWIIGSKL